MIKIGTTTPLLFEDSLIISLSKDWIEQFDEIPEFMVILDNRGRLCIRSIKEVEEIDK